MPESLKDEPRVLAVSDENIDAQTDAVKDADGNSYFQDNRGAVSFMDNGRAIITLFQG